MVNIRAVIIITEQTVQTYKNIEHWWSRLQELSTPEDRGSQSLFKQRLDRGAGQLAREYSLHPSDTKDVGFIYGFDEEAKVAMADHETRVLLCNPIHIVVLQLRRTHERVIIIATVHTPTSHRIITSVLKPDHLLAPMIRGEPGPLFPKPPEKYTED